MKLKRGDVVRLTMNVSVRSDRGVLRTYQAGHEFEVVAVDGAAVAVRESFGVRLTLLARVLEFVRAAHSPDDDDTATANDGDHTGGGPVGRLPKRRGLVRVGGGA